MRQISPIIQTRIAEQQKIGDSKKNFHENKTITHKIQNKSLSFGAQYHSNIDLLNKLVSEHRKTELNQPLTDKEYFDCMKRVLASCDESCSDNTDKQTPLWNAYKYADEELLGLAPYCALHDWHEYINNYVTNVKSNTVETYNYDETRKLPTRVAHDVTKCLDYSLSKLDEKYGQYDGVLYRSGILDKNLKQYYSTSSTPECSIRHADFKMPDDKNIYNIIYTNKGHKIYEFQKMARVIGNFINDGEQEILLDRNISFQEIEEKDYTEEQINCKLDFLYKIAKEYDLENNTNIFNLIINNPEEREKYLSSIKLWKTV